MSLLSRLVEPNGRRLAPASVALLLAPFLALMVVGFLYPLVSMLAISVLEPTPANYQRALTDPVFQRNLLRTLEVALTVSVAALAMAFPVALLMARAKGPKVVIITACIVLPLWSSVLVRTTAWPSCCNATASSTRRCSGCTSPTCR